MPPLIDMVGRVFGDLTVISKGPRKPTTTMWLCRCVCGEERMCQRDNLTARRTTSCGCGRLRKFIDRITKHGGCGDSRRGGTPTYRSWRAMRERCRYPQSKSYVNYGGRGISVCARWDDFGNFLADMGERPSDAHSIDRINNDGNYEPGNCKWATRQEQHSNKRQRQGEAFYKSRRAAKRDGATKCHI
jgi:hypothetical protein